VALLATIAIIPLLPALGFALNGLLGTRYLPKKAVAWIGCSAVLLSFLLSLGAILALNDVGRLAPAPGQSVDPVAHRVTYSLYSWMPMGRSETGEELRVDWAYALDPLSAVMLLVVTGVGFLIHVYSIGYMAHEPRPSFARFFSYLNLFMAMMLTLVLGASLPVVFVGWEGVGLCSYLLIGFYYDRMFDDTTKMTCADAGRKAFLVNRVGDVGFILGMLLLFGQTGTLDIQGILGKVGGLPTGACTLAALLLFFGACGKSAQIPLYVWLPDAMAGPTPVSALIHAATMVTAGVYVTCRMAPLYLHAPAAMTVVAVVGALTALFAASIGLAQTDIKKVLAYSTVSQLGYMMLAAGAGAFSAAIFHLMTHAFFKALLFLGAGSVIHAMSGEQDIRKMGGLEKYVPWTHITFIIATLAISGIVPLAGFFSKDAILWAAWSARPVLWVVGVGTAGLTAFYMARLYTLVFRGNERFGDAVRHHVHESPRTMTAPLVVLAVLSCVGGWVGIPEVFRFPNLLEDYLAPVFRAGAVATPHAVHAPGLEWALMGVSLVIAALALLFGWACYERWPEIPERLAESARGLYRLIVHKYFVDEIYGTIVLAPYDALCRWAAWFDQWIVDGCVNAAAYVTLAGSYISVGFDTYVVDGLVNLAGYTVRGASWVFRGLQTGIVQSYATAMILGIFVLVSVYLLSSGH
jgi:NADH-quinone oxidoreductase subunit L